MSIPSSGRVLSSKHRARFDAREPDLRQSSWTVTLAASLRARRGAHAIASEAKMLRSAYRRLITITLVGVAAACAGPAGSASTSPRHDSTVITAEDMTRVQATNLYDVVHRLHPEWLNQRTAATVGSLDSRAPAQPIDVQVFLDSQHIGTSETLKQLVVSTTSSLKYYSAAEAQTRFGAGNLNGVIQVIMTKP
jgi:hypothetical protein